MGYIMNTSNHYLVRSQQRGIPQELVDFILFFGAPKPRPGKAYEYSIKKKEINNLTKVFKQAINYLDRCKGKAVLVNDDSSTLITVYHKKQ